MASWIMHLRIAERFLQSLPDVDETAFVFGHLAPDSGVPAGDSFDPPKSVSHCLGRDENGRFVFRYGDFISQYFTLQQRAAYDRRTDSFFLGYLMHLITDSLWAQRIHRPAIHRNLDAWKRDPDALVLLFKRDWYDVDFLYLRDQPPLRAFEIYRRTEAFENTFLPFFPPDAFTAKRRHILAFYAEERGNLNRAYPYLTPQRAEEFVGEAVAAIRQEMETKK